MIKKLDFLVTMRNNFIQGLIIVDVTEVFFQPVSLLLCVWGGWVGGTTLELNYCLIHYTVIFIKRRANI